MIRPFGPGALYGSDIQSILDGEPHHIRRCTEAGANRRVRHRPLEHPRRSFRRFGTVVDIRRTFSRSTNPGQQRTDHDVVPFHWTVASTVPEQGASTSRIVFAVSTSAIGSPFSTTVPGLTIQRLSVPSWVSAAMGGILTSVAIRVFHIHGKFRL